MQKMQYKPLIDVSKLPVPPGPRDIKGVRPTIPEQWGYYVVWWAIGSVAITGLLYAAFTLGSLL